MRHVFDYIKKNRFLLLVIVPALIFHLLIILPSGTYLCYHDQCGYFFWGAHGHDAIWHLAIVSVAFSKFPFISPTYVGSNLAGYNYLLDLVVYILTKVGIPGIITYFKILPFVWFVLFTFFGIRVARKIKDDPRFVGVFMFFLYFAGSFGYIFTLFHHGTLAGSESNLALQSGHSLINLQYAFSLVIFLAVIDHLKDIKEITYKSCTFLAAMLFVALGLKFYSAVILGFFIVGYIFLRFMRGKTKGKLLTLCIGLVLAFIVALFLFYNPISSSQKEAVFKFAPFAIVHSMIEEPDLFYMRDLVNARYFLQTQRVGPKLLEIELLTVLLFVVFNFGTRIFGLFYFFVQCVRRKSDEFHLSIFASMFFATTISVLFIQRGEWWNTVQFFYFAIFLANIFGAEFIYELLRKKNILISGLVLILLILTVPINIDLMKDFSAFPPASYLPNNEIKALQFLSARPAGVVLADTYDHANKIQFKEPVPLYAYDDTAYVAAFSGKQTYLDDLVQLRLTGVDYTKRRELIANGDCRVYQSVRYLYTRNAFTNITCLKQTGKVASEIYHKENIIIYEVVSSSKSP